MLIEFKLIRKLKPYLAVIFMQFGYAGTAIIAKAALNQGMNHYIFSVYRNAIAAVCFAPFAFVLERKIRPRMTFPVLLKIALLALLEPVIDQNLYYTGMKYTTATFTSAMCNILPAITFLLAWTLRLEKVKLKRLYDQAKVVGTIVTIGGAMIMTVVRGHVIGFPWNNNNHYSRMTNNNNNIVKDQEEPIKGTIMITIGCFCWSIFYILQANTLKTYPAGLTLTTLICMAGALQGGALTLVVETANPQVWSIGWDVKLLAYAYAANTLKTYPAGLTLTTLICMAGALQGGALTLVVETANPQVWSIGWDVKLLAYAYAGIVSSGVGYYVSGVVSKEKGPVFLTSFNPLSMVIVAVMSSFIFADKLNVGKVTGASVIIIGLYLVIWSRTMDQNESVCTSSPDDPIQQQNHDDSKFVSESESEHNNNNNNNIVLGHNNIV